MTLSDFMDKQDELATNALAAYDELFPDEEPKIAEAIKLVQERLPGWWWSVGDCSVSADASCGPDRNGPDYPLLEYRMFDNGFHFDDRHENKNASPARSLVIVMLMALEGKGAVNG